LTKSEIRLDELTIKSLINQAKDEGILVELEASELNQGIVLIWKKTTFIQLIEINIFLII
jgi:hypothetical protein